MSIRRLAASASIAAASTARVELVEALAYRVGGVHHHRLRKLPDVVAEDAVGAEIGGGDGQGRRELDLELAEGAGADGAAEAGDGGLAHAGAARELADGEAGRGLEILAHRFRRRGARRG